MMKEKLQSIIRVSVLSFLLAGLSGGPFSLETPAQFGGIVHDPANYALQLRKFTEEFQRWLQTIDFYARTIENQIAQVTNLRGILHMAERQLGFNRRMLQTISDIGRTIRAAFRIKTTLENLVTGRMRSLARIHDRLAHGIFDPAADKRDLMDYLRWEMGQISERTLGDIERQEEMDNTLQMMQMEMELRKKRIADAEQSAQRTSELIEEMHRNPAQVTQLDVQLAELETRQRDFEVQLSRDREEMLKLQREVLIRRERIAGDTLEGRRVGSQIRTMNESWKRLTEALNRLRFAPPVSDEGGSH